MGSMYTIKVRSSAREELVEFTEQVQEKLRDSGEREGIVVLYVQHTTAGLTVNDLPFAVERQSGKVGRKMASIGVPIISEEQARADHPEYMLVAPWFFRYVFIERERDYLKSGGRLIFPLPDLEIVDASTV